MNTHQRHRNPAPQRIAEAPEKGDATSSATNLRQFLATHNSQRGGKENQLRSRTDLGGRMPKSAVLENTPASEPTTIIKTTVNLPSDAIQALKEMATGRGTTVADIIRRAIWVEKYLYDATKEGSKILVEQPDKSVKELVIR